MPLIYENGTARDVRSVWRWRARRWLIRVAQSFKVEYETMPLHPHVRKRLEQGDLSALMTDFRPRAEVFPFQAEDQAENPPPASTSSAIG